MKSETMSLVQDVGLSLLRTICYMGIFRIRQYIILHPYLTQISNLMQFSLYKEKQFTITTNYDQTIKHITQLNIRINIFTAKESSS